MSTPSTTSPGSSPVARRWACLALGLLMVCSGCPSPNSGGSNAGTTAAKAPGKKTANAVLDRMIDVYQKAESYRDRAYVQFRVAADGQVQQMRFDTKVEFSRPNRFRLEIDTVVERPCTVVSDGENIFARLEGFDGQVVVVPAPKKVEVPQLFEMEGLDSAVLPSVAGHPIQLELLTAAKPLAAQRAKDKSPMLLDPESLGDRMCDVVQLMTQDGWLTFWIDQETSVLRRMALPNEEFLRRAPQADEVSLIVHFKDAELNVPEAELQFSWKGSDKEIFVREIVRPPSASLKPHPLLGKQAPNFPFLRSDGTRGDVEGLFGKITVIDFWATWCNPCRKSMPIVDRVRKDFAGNDKVQFLAVSLDDANVGSEDIGDVIEQVGAGIPWARTTLPDPSAVYKLYQTDGIPTMVILDSQGRVADFHIGFNPAAVRDNLSRKINDLLEGKDLVKPAFDRWQAAQRDFQERLAAVRIEADTQEVEVPLADIAKRSEPKSMTITKLWTNTKLKSPGNLLVIEEQDRSPRILVVDGPRSIVELDQEGNIVARHDDLIPEDAAISFLRTAVDGAGKRIYAASGREQKQLFLFDADWKHSLTYPQEPGPARILDFVLADLSGKGELGLYIGYAGPAGVHGVSLAGRRRWSNRGIENVGDMAVADDADSKRRRLLCAHMFGSLMPIQHDGTAASPVHIRNRAVTHVAAADLLGKGRRSTCLITVDLNQQRVAVGLSRDGSVDWQYELPAGEHTNPIESLAVADLLPGRPKQWLYAAADGSVHIIAHDGSEADHFNTGIALTGIAATRIGDKRVLLTAAKEGVTAWQIEPKP